LPRQPTKLEELAERAGMTADEYREHLRFEIAVKQEEAEQAWRAELYAAAGLESSFPYGEEGVMDDPNVPPVLARLELLARCAERIGDEAETLEDELAKLVGELTGEPITGASDAPVLRQ
jgi:hypothetical protein